MSDDPAPVRDPLNQLLDERFALALADSTGDGFLVLDAAGRIRYANAAVSDLSGWPKGEMLEQPLARFAPAGGPLSRAWDDAAHPLRPVLDDGATIRGEEAAILCQDGDTLPVTYTAAPILDGQTAVGATFVFGDVTRRSALRTHSEQLAAAQELTHVGSWEWYPESGRSIWTAEMYRIYGLEPDSEPPGPEGLLEIVHPDDRARVEQVIQDAIEKQEAYEHSYRILWPDGAERGAERIVHTQASVETNDAGRTLRLWGTTQDITEARQVEEHIRKAKQLSERLINSSINGIIAFDRECRYVVWNPAMVKMTGVSREEALGQRAFDVFPFLEETGEAQYFYRALAGEEVPVTNRRYNVPKTGRQGYFEAHYSPLRDEAGQIIGGLIWIQDITQQRRAEAARKQSEKQFRAIFKYAATGTLLLNTDGSVVQSNPAAQEMLGRSGGALQSVQFQTLVADPFVGRYARGFEQLLDEKRRSVQFEVRCQRPNGERPWVHLTASAIRGPERRPYRIIIMLKDIEARKAVETELKEVQHRLSRSREQERLHLAQELHDGPIQDLYAAKFQLQLLRNMSSDEALREQAAAAQKIVQEVNDTLRIICGDLRPPTLVPFGLEVAIRSHAESFQEMYPDLVVQLDLTPDEQALPEVARLTLFRIYQEALSNVAKHAEAEHVLIRLDVNEDQVTLEVQDDGRGFIVPNRWIELAREGHLGLVGAAERAEEIGGQLVLLAAPNRGSIVRVTARRPIPSKSDSVVHALINKEPIAVGEIL